MDTMRPVLMTKVPGKYGRCEFERVDHVASSHMRAGHGKIGKVEIDCKFLFTKSQWGVLNPSRHPAGIIYLDLDFLQPADCRLRSATVLVTLEEDGAKHNSNEANPTTCPVQFTDYYGPKNLSGLERVVRTRRTKNMTPAVQFLGNGAGGLGIDTERMKHTTSRWKFSGHIRPGAGSIWYNELRWELEESSLEDQPMHSNVIHTAFAIAHNKKRLYMNVKITGKLASRSERFRRKFKFGGSLTPEEETVTTVIEWRNGYPCEKRLDKMAKGLALAMEAENLASVPLEVPDAMSAGFGQTAPTMPLPGSIHQQYDTSSGVFIEGIGDDAWLEGDIPPRNPQGLLGMVPHQQRPLEPTWENMSLAAGLEIPVVNSEDRPPYQRSESRWSSGETLVENGAESVSGRSTVSRPRLKKIEEEAGSPEKEEQQNEVRAERIFGLLLLLSWLTSTGLFCVTVVADALGYSLGKQSRGFALIEEGKEMACNNDDEKKQEDEDVRDASDAETEGPISLASSPVTRRITFEHPVERIGQRGRREYLVRGERENYILGEARL